MKTIQNNRLILLIICIVLAVSGCGAKHITQQKTTLLEIRKPVLAEKSGEDNRPEWTSERPFFEDDKGLHYTGGYMGGADYALSLRIAKGEAIKNLLESVQIKAGAEFSNALQGQNRDDTDIGRYVTDAVAWIVDNLKIQGITQQTIYYEQVFDPMSQSFKYNAWDQVQISKMDYLQAKINAAKKMVDKTLQEKDLEAEAKARELLERLRQET